MHKITLLLMLCSAAPAYAFRQPFFEFFANYEQRVSFVVKKPTFTDKLEHYRLLYRHPSWHVGISAAAYLPVHRMCSLGVGFGLDWYQDSGMAAQLEEGTLTPVDEEKTQLTILPLSMMLVTALKPLGEWLSLDLGIGLEYLYGQESRMMSGSATADEERYLAPLLNRVWQPYRLWQARVSISLHRLERRAMRALQRGFGISNVYLSLGMEQAQRLSGSGADFSRHSYSIGITFEAAG